MSYLKYRVTTKSLGYISLVMFISFMLHLTFFTPERIFAQEPANGIPEGFMIIEGDIVVPEDFYNPGGISPQSAFGDTTFWPNGIVPFVFDANVSNTNRTRTLNAMALWENVANVDFRPRNGESNWVRIHASTANNSQVGMVGGQQDINIFSWNNQWIIAHELAHALGIWHEQSRPDRGNYVQINSANIESEKEHNFNIRDAADVYPKGAYGLPDAQTYDFDSVMHYGQCAFANDSCPPNTTITVLPPNQSWQTQIGQRNHLSDLDQLTMSFIYSETNWRFVDSTYSGSQNGSFVRPYREYTTGIANIPNNSVLWIQPGTYSAVGTYSKPTVLQAPLGNVVLR